VAIIGYLPFQHWHNTKRSTKRCVVFVAGALCCLLAVRLILNYIPYYHGSVCFFLFAIHVRGGVGSRVYSQLATIVAEMHFTLAHFGGCTSSQSQSQDTSHVASRSAFMAGFCFVFLCKLLFFKEVEGYKGFMLDGCAQVTLNGSHILRLSSCSPFPYLFPSLFPAIKWLKWQLKVPLHFKAFPFG